MAEADSWKVSRDLAGTTRLCEVNQWQIQRIVARHRMAMMGIENDRSAIVKQCDGHKTTVFLPIGLSIDDDDPDKTYLARLWNLFDIPDAVWGAQPRLYDYDPEAEEAGKEWAALAQEKNYKKDDPFDVFAGYLSSY